MAGLGYQTIPDWSELLRKDEARKKAMMLQRAQEAGIPYSPQYNSLSAMAEPDSMYAQPPQAPAAPAAPPPSSVAATGPGAAPSPNPSAPPPSGQMGPPESLAGGGVAPNSSIWEELGPEGIEAILEGQAIEEQKQYADALRRTPGAEGRTVRNGIYVGASPLEHIAVGYRRHKGKKGVKEAQQKQQGIRKSIIDILREKTEEQEEPSLAPTSMRDLM